MNFLFGNRLLNRQTSPKSEINGVVRQTCFFRPLLDGLRFIVDGYISSVPFVSCLICSGRPLAVFWRVPKIVINTLKGKALWFFAHVRQKVLKFKPPFAHGNSPCAIIFVGLIAFTKTSFFHASPNLVGRRVLSPHSVSV